MAKENLMKKEIIVSRRSILKGAVGMSAMAAAGSLALDLTPQKAEGSILRTIPKKWDETIDVVVVGSGFAGLAAAAEAAGGGSQTVVLEKMPTYGGNSIISGGSYSSWDDKYHLRQEQNLGNDSPAKWKEDWLKGGDFYGVPELIEVIVNGAAPALNWMIDEGGLEIRKVLARHGGHSAFRAHMAIEAVGRPYTDALKKIAEKHGTKIRLGTQVSWIWRKDMDGPVLGVEVTKGNKKTNIKVKKALILASGGFSRDVKMRIAFNPALVPEFNCTNQPGSTGEIIRYAQAIGADALQLAFIQMFPFAEPESGILDVFATYPAKGAGYGFVYVNKLGKRFVDEMERRDVIAYAQIKTGVKPTYSIFNRLMMQKMEGEKELEAGVRKGRFIHGDTITELAGKLGIPGDAMQETVSKYNKYLQEGKDSDFNKKISKQMVPLAEGPFYAVAQWPAVHHTMGGLRINPNAQIVDIWGNPIPRLYAAGEVTGGIHGSNRLAGNAYPDCVVFGRIAGVNAAKEKA